MMIKILSFLFPLYILGRLLMQLVDLERLE